VSTPGTRPSTAVSFDAACAQVHAALAARRDILDDIASVRTFRAALARLREMMRTDVWPAGGASVNLGRYVHAFDRQMRLHGFHALHDWDGKAERVNEQTIPVDVLDFIAGLRGDEPPDRAALAILLDYHFLYVLALLSLKIWDHVAADENLDRLDRLLGDLQGAGGSGQPFVADSETLLLIATSHYELEDGAYDRLLDRVRTLDERHRTRIALSHAAGLGSHLRFGFEATYGRDTVVMRNDNVADYPWLSFSVATLMREYLRLRDAGTAGSEREGVVEALANGLAPDARAFVGNHPPPSLARCEEERVAFRAQFLACKDDLLREMEPHRPTLQSYSPFSFFFNFSQNVLKGTVVDALLRGRAWPLSLNDLLTAVPRDEDRAREKERLALTLMGYARSSPDRIRGKLTPVIVYDPAAGRQAFAVAVRKLKEG
jgi:hypothetical protein